MLMGKQFYLMYYSKNFEAVVMEQVSQPPVMSVSALDFEQELLHGKGVKRVAATVFTMAKRRGPSKFFAK